MAMSVLSTEREKTERNGSRSRAPISLDLKVAYFMLGITLPLCVYFIYGAQNALPKIVKDSTPVHIYHHEYTLSGKTAAPRG